MKWMWAPKQFRLDMKLLQLTTYLIMGILAPQDLWSSEKRKHIDFDDTLRRSQGDSLFNYFNNPTLSSGLVTGVRSLNQSVDSLMESIFYDLMDQEFFLAFGDDFGLVTRYERNLHETAFGGYIVVDQFRLGPRFGRQLGQFSGIPIRLGAETGVDVINITHRSDATRAAEQAALPYWQGLIQNWGGLLPILTRVLPPSFNPLEMYDPINYLKTPFLFPKTASDVKQMPIGSIRSIGLSGGISIAIDVLEPELERIREQLRLPDLNFQLPYGVFKTGYHRLHVMRRTENLVWLAITDQRDLGHKIESRLRNNFRIFSKILPIWDGIPAPVYPIDLLLSRAQIKRFDELYSFDLRVEPARQAFEKALSGDLINASQLANTDPESGVIKHFDRHTTAMETQHRSTRSVYVQHDDRRQALSRSVVTINDSHKNHYFLEVEHLTRDTDWNVLVGAENIQVDNRLLVNVLKVHDEHGEVEFVFDPEDTSPYSLTSTINIQDRFLDTRDYRKIIQLLSYSTGMPVESSVPVLPIMARDQVERFAQDHKYLDPMTRHHIVEPTPVHLGRLYAQARIYIPFHSLQNLRKTSERQIRQAVQAGFSSDAYAQPEDFKHEPAWGWLRKSFALLLRPLRLVNVRSPSFDVSLEVDRLTRAIHEFQQAETPLQLSQGFESILSTQYPIELLRSLMFLMNPRDFSRRIEFTAQAQRKRRDSPDSSEMKRNFASLDQTTIDTGPPIPSRMTHQFVNDLLATFTPAGHQMDSLVIRLLGAHARAQLTKSQQALLILELETLPSRPDVNEAHIYLRLEQAGAVNLGRFFLGEGIVTSRLQKSEDTSKWLARLMIGSPGGDHEKVDFRTKLVPGSRYDLYLSASEDRRQWGPERLIRFRVDRQGEVHLD